MSPLFPHSISILPVSRSASTLGVVNLINGRTCAWSSGSSSSRHWQFLSSRLHPSLRNSLYIFLALSHRHIGTDTNYPRISLLSSSALTLLLSPSLCISSSLSTFLPLLAKTLQQRSRGYSVPIYIYVEWLNSERVLQKSLQRHQLEIFRMGE